MVDSDNLILDKNLRDKLSNRIDVLDKVKKIVTLPGTAFVTLDQMADYYSVHMYHLKKVVSNNKEEIENDGCELLTKDQYKNYCSINTTLVQTQGSATYTLPSGEKVIIPNRGLRVFSKRAVLRIGMLLTKSEVAKQLRTDLLDVATGEVPVITTVQNAIEDANDRYIELHTKQYNLIMSGDMDGALIVQAEIRNYEIRHEQEMQNKINELTPKAEAYDDLCKSEFAHETKDASKVIGFGRNTFRNMLKRDKYLMEDGTPYQRYIDMGLFELRLKRYPRQHYTYHMTYVTDKGITYFKKLYSGKAVNP